MNILYDGYGCWHLSSYSCLTDGIGQEKSCWPNVESGHRTSEPSVSQSYVDETQHYLYFKNYKETNESLSIPRAPEDPSLLMSFKTHCCSNLESTGISYWLFLFISIINPCQQFVIFITFINIVCFYCRRGNL